MFKKSRVASRLARQLQLQGSQPAAQGQGQGQQQRPREETQPRPPKQDYLDNCHRTYSCIHCRAHLANHDELISKLFQGNHGRAYLFNKVVNVGCKQAITRELLTGLHAVCDIYCKTCETTLGWKYEQAFVASQKYKEGKYIIELVHMLKENNSDPSSYDYAQQVGGRGDPEPELLVPRYAMREQTAQCGPGATSDTRNTTTTGTTTGTTTATATATRGNCCSIASAAPALRQEGLLNRAPPARRASIQLATAAVAAAALRGDANQVALEMPPSECLATCPADGSTMSSLESSGGGGTDDSPLPTEHLAALGANSVPSDSNPMGATLRINMSESEEESRPADGMLESSLDERLRPREARTPQPTGGQQKEPDNWAQHPNHHAQQRSHCRRHVDPPGPPAMGLLAPALGLGAASGSSENSGSELSSSSQASLVEGQVAE